MMIGMQNKNQINMINDHRNPTCTRCKKGFVTRILVSKMFPITYKIFCSNAKCNFSKELVNDKMSGIMQ